jgi:membrane fusion protein, copper/silver efflux system
MNTKQITLIIGALVFGLVVGLWLGGDEISVSMTEGPSVYRCPMHPTVVSDKPAQCPICGMDLVEDAPERAGHDVVASAASTHDVYRCPMHPTVVSDKPAQCPICGMDLVEDAPARSGGEGHAAHPGEVRIDPTTVQNIGVKTATVERRTLSRTVRTVGRVDYDETGLTDVNTKVMGWVEKLYVDYTGQVVKKGEPLLQIYSPELVAAQEEYLTALDYSEQVNREASSDVAQGADDLLESARQRLLLWDITQDQIAELASTRKATRTMTIYSPQQGVVVHKAVYDGAHIKAGQHLYRIADLSTAWVFADVYEYELPWIKKGQMSEVSLSYLPGKVFHGKVTYVYPFLEPKTRTVKVRMEFPNLAYELKPEMYASVRIMPTVSRDALVVPNQAVIRSGDRNVVVMDLGEGRFAPREIVLGAESDQGIEVLEGLHEGERIVTSSQFLIDSESNLKAALASMGDGEDIQPASTGHQH